MKKSSLTIYSVIFGASFAHAESLAFKFLDSTDTVIPASATAGAGFYAQPNWNLLLTDWSGNGENDAIMDAIVNSSGAVTTSLLDITYGVHVDPVHYDANNTWRSGAGNADANATLMNGYLDDGLDNQPYFNLSLDGAAFPIYTVVVYFNGDGQGGSVGRYWIEEWTDPLQPGTVITDQVGITSNSYTGTFEQAGMDFGQTDAPTNVDVPSGNYLVFTNLTARNIRIRSAGNGDPEDFGRGPLNAIQILDIVADPGGDIDNDGLLNGWEVSFDLDPNSDSGDDGAAGDPDMDGLTNLQEQSGGTNPVKDDSDSDGLKDGVETGGGVWTSTTDTGTDPLVPDSDADGLLDGVENNTGIFVDAMMTGSNPNDADTDDDLLPDGWEAAAGLDPSDDGTTNVKNGPDGDPDADFSANSEEFARGTDAANEDTDMDTLKDGYENLSGIFEGPTMTGTDPLNDDTDGDTILDGFETGDGNYLDAMRTGTDPNLHDTDDDGFYDEQELAAGTNPNSSASKPVLLPPPLAFWTFDDQGETVTADLTGNGNDGTVVGAPVYAPGHSTRPGDFSIDFDGVDDAVTTMLSLSNTPVFAMSGWVKFDTVQTDRSGLFGQNDILEFGFTAGDNLQAWTNPGGGVDTILAVSDEWVHIAVVGDNTGRVIYLDGVESARGAAATPLNASAFFFNIGGGGILDATGNFFEGQIDDVAIWTTPLSPILIKQLADGTSTPLPQAGGDLQITSIARDATGKITLTVEGAVSNVSYSINESLNLIDWTEVDDFTGAEGGAATVLEFVPENGLGKSKAFYYVAPITQ